ncbi:MAG TPA: hypothetical protein VJ761_01090 [Ktedonobacteraceae bacterium]|nr:hypothetical protein [Ktedonobacteraceae bacterium]
MNRIRMKVLPLLLVAVALALLLRTGVAEAASWSVIPSPDGPSGNSLLNGIAVISSHDIWAVGEDFPSGSEQTLTEHWNGSQWTVVPSPNNQSIDTLSGVAAVSTNDVWAVGSAFNGHYETLIEHWDGSQWSVVSSPNPGSLTDSLQGIVALSANDVWAVGAYQNSSSSPLQALTEHWNGSQWSVVSSPNTGNDYLLSGVAAISTKDVWAVGAYFSSNGGPLLTFIEHWDGSQWSIVSSPTRQSCDQLYSVTAISTNDAWAVGYSSQNCNSKYFSGRALIEHWNGKKWSIASSPRPPKNSTLTGIAAASQNDVWAVGNNGSRNKFSALTEHWNGTQWSIVSSPNPGTKTDQFDAVVASGNNFWAVGYYVNSHDYHDQTLTELYA